MILWLVKGLARRLARRGHCWALYNGDHSFYLKRHIVFGQTPDEDSKPAFSLYLHNLCSGDVDGPHSHPWPISCALLVAGSYIEERWAHAKAKSRYRRLGRFALNLLCPKNYHRIDSVMPDTWSLFFSAPEKRGWNFLIDGQEIPNKEAPKTVYGWWLIDENGNRIRPARSKSGNQVRSIADAMGAI
jgi:hypothetical protein